MQDISQNNWKSSLADPGSLPGETIRDKNESWEKLYSRLHEKPPRKIVAWSWVAASLLIVTVGALLLLVNKGSHTDVASKDASPVKKEMPAAIQPKRVVTPGNNVAVSKSKTGNGVTVAHYKKSSVTAIQLTNNHLITDSISKQLPELVAQPTFAQDTIKAVAVTTPPKKKLRVVHLNEIGQPTVEPTVNNGFSERRFFGLKIMNADYYDPVNTNSSNTLILTKPRNTPN